MERDAAVNAQRPMPESTLLQMYGHMKNDLGISFRIPVLGVRERESVRLSVKC